jgi:hypothetical protein
MEVPVNKIAVLCVAAAVLTGCGGGSSSKKDACSPNATLDFKSVSVEKSEAPDSSQLVLIRAGSTVSEQIETKVLLASGETASFKENSPSAEEDDEDTAIDFAKKTITLSGRKVSFERDAQLSASKGFDVFVTNEEQTKAALQAVTNADKEAGMKICSVSKAKIQFSHDQAKNTVGTETTFVMSVQLDADIVASVKSGQLDDQEIIEEEVAE